MGEKGFRDVLADRIAKWAGEAGVYDYADRLIKDLDSAGWEIAPLGTLERLQDMDPLIAEHEHEWGPYVRRYCLACDAHSDALSLDGAEAGTGLSGSSPSVASTAPCRENFPPASGTVTPLVASGAENESDPPEIDGEPS